MWNPITWVAMDNLKSICYPKCKTGLLEKSQEPQGTIYFVNRQIFPRILEFTEDLS